MICMQHINNDFNIVMFQINVSLAKYYENLVDSTVQDNVN